MTKKYNVSWSRTAEHDLESIIDYIAEDSPLNARKGLTRIKEKSSVLYSCPARERIVPELKEFTILQYRELIADPWRIIYKIADDKVIVMSIIDARRNLEDVLLARLIKINPPPANRPSPSFLCHSQETGGGPHRMVPV